MALATCLCLTMQSLAQADCHDACTGAHVAIVNLDFDGARSAIAGMDADNECANWLSAYALFVETLARQEKPDADRFTHFLKKAKEHSGSSPLHLQCLSDIYLMKCYAQFSTGSYVMSASSYMKARQAIDDIAEKQPDDWRCKRFELLRIVVDAQVHKTFHALADGLTPDERARKYCNLAGSLIADNSVPEPFKDEVRIASLLLLPLVTDDGGFAEQLMLKFGNGWVARNPLAVYATALQLVRCNKPDMAKDVLASAGNACFERFNLLNLQFGGLLLNLRNDSCQLYLNRYIGSQRNKSNIAYAKFKLAWHHFMKGDTNMAKQLCIKVIQSPVLTPDDVQAKYECSLFQHWDTVLITARLMFDAGHYAECRNLLQRNESYMNRFSSIQTCEYAYRMGRACHKLGDFANAKRYYSAAMASDLCQTLYYPCYSAYYLGLIYKQDGNNEKANECFRTCMRMDSPIYGDEIHRKAKNAVE